jgi:hypothetical protein
VIWQSVEGGDKHHERILQRYRAGPPARSQSPDTVPDVIQPCGAAPQPVPQTPPTRRSIDAPALRCYFPHRFPGRNE